MWFYQPIPAGGTGGAAAYTMSLGVGTLTLTGKAIAMRRGLTRPLAHGTLTLTGEAIAMRFGARSGQPALSIKISLGF